MFAALTITGLVATCGIALNRLANGMCGNTVLSETASPNGEHRLVTFQRDCGATTGFSTQVSLLEANERLPNESGNVFVADTDHGLAPQGPGGGPEVRVRWTSPHGALIERHERARVFKSEALFGGVGFGFKTFH